MSSQQQPTATNKQHWEKVYTEKTLDEQVSWYQPVPQTSKQLILNHVPPQSCNVIDIGSGNSNLSVELFKNRPEMHLTLVDISQKALERGKQKLVQEVGEAAVSSQVQFVESNVVELHVEKEQYDVWHDRATFHFLTSHEDQVKYVKLVSDALKIGGYLILATFSANNGPKQCSGLPIVQYSVEKMMELISSVSPQCFELETSFEELHTTPFNTTQNFLYMIFKRIK